MMEIDYKILQLPLVQTSLAILVVLASLYLLDVVIKWVVRGVVNSSQMDSHEWVKAFLQNKRLISCVCFLPYLFIIHLAWEWVPHIPERLSMMVQRFILATAILVCLFILSQITRVIDELYRRHEISRSRPIKGYLQTIEIVAYFMGIICIMAALLDKSPVIFLSGLGAITAILLLIFRDSILSLVAGIQLTMNGLIRVGDWIEMPQFNADGDVVEIALHSVKVQNWDRTITVIPAHKFLEHSFKNWRGMQEAGGRRIKRSLNIDITSIRFLTADDIQKFSQFRLLHKYLQQKVQDVGAYNQQIDSEALKFGVNTRRLTNVGTFRAYLTEYLKEHPLIHKNMTFMVRQLAPGSEGLPIEIYVFTNDTRWAVYEGAQADIFDHLLAVLPEFGLRFYQQPSGDDIKKSLGRLVAQEVML
ncbi:mechanosensitive ion channel family protein [Bdellovibrio bacteriovorus]|uniref:mechanosensitive ion channel family protein n=1 Tax=Bdellovibrio bacteriovorus TaxID=959 RepID=UPI0021D1758C|nr:mechanosensitive ion channel family protein [Bdellovibrio bacteriovorus]UXR64628.1 mechanosensitive ion channel family protein [Bdellovibrio bacteriovorus]